MNIEEQVKHSKEVRRKYRRWKKVDPEDKDAVLTFADILMADICYKNDEMYARII